MKIILKTAAPGVCEEIGVFAAIDEDFRAWAVNMEPQAVIELSEEQAHELRKWLERHLLGVKVDSV